MADRRTKRIGLTTHSTWSRTKAVLEQEGGGSAADPVRAAVAPSPLPLSPSAPTEVQLIISIATKNRPMEFCKCFKLALAQMRDSDKMIIAATGSMMVPYVQKAVDEDDRITGLILRDGSSVNSARRAINCHVPQYAVVVELGDNDYLRAGALERIRDAFEVEHVGVVYGNFQPVDGEGKPKSEVIEKKPWERGAHKRRCEVRGLHGYRKAIFDKWGGWYEDECPAGDHANALRWEDAGVIFHSLGGDPIVDVTIDSHGMSHGSNKVQQHLNSQKFARGEYRKKVSVSLIAWAIAGRRTKMLALLDWMLDPENVKLYASAKNRYRASSDTDASIRRRTVYWRDEPDILQKLDPDTVPHLFVDRIYIAPALVQAGRRVVVDVCDLRTQRCGEGADRSEEILCTSGNVWLMFVSEGHRDYICEKYGVPVERTRIIPNLPMKSWRPLTPLAAEDKVPNSIVYYGGITARKNSNWSYRYYKTAFDAFKAAGIEVHIYASTPRTELGTEYNGFHLHEKFDHRNIYETIRRYDVGFAGYEDRAGCPKVAHDYAMGCYPNKATDYMMAGIPTLSYALGLAEKDIKNWGICVPNGRADDLVDAYFAAKAMTIDWDRWQNEFCMERQAGKIMDAYRWVREGAEHGGSQETEVVPDGDQLRVREEVAGQRGGVEDEHSLNEGGLHMPAWQDGRGQDAEGRVT